MDFLNMSQNELLTLFYVEAQIVCIILLGLILRRNISESNSTRSRYMTMVIICMIIYYIGDALWAFCFFGIMPHGDIIIKYMRITYYTASGFATYAWLMYLEIFMGTKLFESRRIRQLFLIPIIISTILVVIICLNGDPSKKTVEGYLTAAGLIVIPYSYLIVVSIHAIVGSFNKSRKGNRRSYLKFGIYPLTLMIVAVAQVYFEEIPIFAFGTTISLIGLFVYSQGALISTDSLTGLNNRAALKKYQSDLDNEDYFVFMIDIDRFKDINDRFGHLEGDIALKYAAKSLKRALSKQPVRHFLARYGGDEFVIIARDITEDDSIKILNDIEFEMANGEDRSGLYNVVSSIGYAKRENDEDYEAVSKRADNMLYEIKAKHHKELGD